MRARRKINTTLGDLIVAVTDEVSPFTSSAAKTNILVSYILNDLFETQRIWLREHLGLESG